MKRRSARQLYCSPPLSLSLSLSFSLCLLLNNCQCIRCRLGKALSFFHWQASPPRVSSPSASHAQLIPSLVALATRCKVLAATFASVFPAAGSLCVPLVFPRCRTHTQGERETVSKVWNFYLHAYFGQKHNQIGISRLEKVRDSAERQRSCTMDTLTARHNTYFPKGHPTWQLQLQQMLDLVRGTHRFTHLHTHTHLRTPCLDSVLGWLNPRASGLSGPHGSVQDRYKA